MPQALNRKEFKVYQQALRSSVFNAVLNEEEIPEDETIVLPPSLRESILPMEYRKNRNILILDWQDVPEPLPTWPAWSARGKSKPGFVGHFWCRLNAWKVFPGLGLRTWSQVRNSREEAILRDAH